VVTNTVGNDNHGAPDMKAGKRSEGARSKRALTGEPAQFGDFPNLKKIVQICKFKTDTFLCSKNIETLYGPRSEYSKQCSQLGQLQIPNRMHAIKFRTYSNSNFL
jgi:hypothetical protein